MRRASREIVLQYIFEYLVQREKREEILEDEYFLELPNVDKEYVLETYDGCIREYGKIIEIIKPNTKRFSIDRLFRMDLAIIVLATYEILVGKVPGEVVINEAVTLSKKFSDPSTTSFINGILGTIYKERGKHIDS